MDENKIIANYLEREEFEDLKDYEGIYKINKKGQIWSIRNKKELSHNGRIGLMTDGKQKQYRIDELLQIQYEGKINEYIHRINLDYYEDIKGYEGFYKINKQGQIWSHFYNKILTPINKEGYLYLDLTDKIKRHKCYIHRLLAIQYIPNPDNLQEVDHIDRNSLNNDLSNLRWANDFIQNNNKCSNIHNKTIEEQEERIEDLKEYKRKWAEKDRREKGIEPSGSKKSYTNEYKSKKQAEYRAVMTEEEKQEHLEHRRELYAKKEQTDKQKEEAKQRAKKQRENIKADPEKLAQIKEYKKLKAREYREKKKQEQTP